MGQQSSKPQNLKYMENYVEVQKQQHPFLGTVTHLSHRGTGTKHFLKIFKFATDGQLNAAVKKANKRKQLSQKRGSSYIVKTTQVESDKHNDLCGITYYLYSVYQDYYSSLGDLIRQKSESKHIFSQQEVLDCMRMACNGLIFLQDNGYKNYTITKQSIVKGYKDQLTNIAPYKVLDVELSKQMQPYPRLLNHIPIQKGTYLAPEVLQQLSSKNTDPDFSLKSDMFSLAMVIAEMCCLEPMDDFYNYDRLKLDHEGLIQRVKNLVHYSSFLKQILLQMLEENQEERIGAVSLKQKLTTNDNKSTTDYAVSGIGNSNVTQRTHKFSYPNNNINDPPMTLNPRLHEHKIIDHRMQRVFTAEQQFRPPAYQPVPIATPISVPVQGDQRKNQTFDQNRFRHLNNFAPGPDHRQQKNRSTQKYKSPEFEVSELNNRQHNTSNAIHFYYPPQTQTKPMTVPVISHAPNNLHNNMPNQQIFSNVKNNPINLIPPKQNIIQNINQNLNQNSNQQMIRKLPEIQIPQYHIEKAEPQTPINHLIDVSTLFTSQPLGSMKIRETKSFSNEDYEVLNSFNARFNKPLSTSQQITNISKPITPINEIKEDYESPPKQQKNPLYASNQSTPIRKVQALQSIPRNSIDQIIKQTEEDEQQQISNSNSNAALKREDKDQIDANGPRTYGKHHFTNGAIYEGQFDAFGNFCGNGVLYYPNGKVCYSGGWVDNSFHGFGVLNNETIANYSIPTNYQNFGLNDPNARHHYEGEFCMDHKNGFGTLYMCNGEKFSGCFVKDQIEGYGTFTANSGQRISGIWSQNVLKKL